MEKPSEQTIERFRSVAPGGAEAEERKMFGQPCAFVHGNMFMGLFGNVFQVRLGPAEQEQAFAAGAEPFAPMGRRMKEYVALPSAIVEDPAALKEWVARACAFAASLPAKEAKPKAPRKPAKVK